MRLISASFIKIYQIQSIMNLLLDPVSYFSETFNRKLQEKKFDLELIYSHLFGHTWGTMYINSLLEKHLYNH